MKTFLPVLVASLITIPLLAQDAKTNAAKVSESGGAIEVGRETAVSNGVVKAPFVLTNGYVSQSVQNDVATDGKVTFTFVVSTTGEYVIQGVVNAPDESANSFFVNIDADPEDPTSIWDIDPTSGFEKRVVSWRGGGTADSDEFAPKRFKLTAGTHKLIIVGREPDAQLKTITILPAPATPKAEAGANK